jgi:HIV Tat-specific factor 1
LITGLPKIKIYTNEQCEPKGDALVTYVKEESVDLAIQMLDGCPLDPLIPVNPETNPEIHVARATFREKTAEELAKGKNQKLILDKRTLQRKQANLEKCV